MSTTPPETPSAPATKTSDRLLTMLGLLLFVAGLIITRLLRDEQDPGLGADIGDILKSFGAVLAAIGGSLPIPELIRRGVGAGGGKVLVTLIAGGILSAGALLGGCGLLGAREIVAERSVQFDVQRGPPCIVKVLADGDLVHTTTGPTVRCGVTIEDAAPPGDPPSTGADRPQGAEQ